MDIGSVVALATVAIAWFSGSGGLLIAATVLTGLGALAALPPYLTGGVTLPASSLAYLLFLVSLFLRGSATAILDAASDFGRLGLLTWFTAWTMVATLIMPGLFSGEIHTYPIRSPGPVSVPTPVGYTASNLT